MHIHLAFKKSLQGQSLWRGDGHMSSNILCEGEGRKGPSINDSDVIYHQFRSALGGCHGNINDVAPAHLK